MTIESTSLYQMIDVVGNIEIEYGITVTLIPESSPQPGIPGYDFRIILCIIGVISAMVLKKKFKSKF